MTFTDQTHHLKVIRDVLTALNAVKTTDFVLKGGTALSLCYDLDRFSEDVDLDSPGAVPTRNTFFATIDQLCKQCGYDYRKAKDTPSVGRVIIHYPDNNTLKVEVSYRKATIDSRSIRIVDGYKVYDLDTLAIMKASAYQSRDKIRDLYDLCFITNEYYDRLSDTTKSVVQAAFEYKSLDQFDYLLRTQSDPLIDPVALEESFLNAFDKCGLLSASSHDEIKTYSPNEYGAMAQEAIDAMDPKPRSRDDGLVR